MRRELVTFRSRDGKLPFVEWLNSIRDNVTNNRILQRMARVETGNFGDHKSVGSGVFELRLDFGPGYRIYYALDGPVVVLLLVGGEKKTQPSDIEKAKEYWAEYKESKR